MQTRKPQRQQLGGMGEETQYLIAELSEVKELTVPTKSRLGIGNRSMGNESHC